jgi:hypothetical protein
MNVSKIDSAKRIVGWCPKMIRPSHCPERNKKYRDQIFKKYGCCPRNLLATNAETCWKCAEEHVDSGVDPTK